MTLADWIEHVRKPHIYREESLQDLAIVNGECFVDCVERELATLRSLLAQAEAREAEVIEAAELRGYDSGVNDSTRKDEAELTALRTLLAQEQTTNHAIKTANCLLVSKLAQAEAREAELQVEIAALKKEIGWTRMK